MITNKRGGSLPLAHSSLFATPSSGAPAFCKKPRNAPLVILILAALVFTGCSKKQAASAKAEFPKAIVALSPAATEILYAIGAQNQIAAVSEFCDYPEQAKSKPVVGGFDGKTLSIEKILSFEPDLVYLTDGMHNFLIQALEEYSIPYYISTANSVDAVKQEILQVGELTGNSKQAQQVVQSMEKKLEPYNNLALNRARKPSVYYEVWNNPYISAGSQSFINDVITLAGGENIFADIDQAYPIVSQEALIAKNPMFILITASSGITVESVINREVWNNTFAVQNNQVYLVDDNLYSRPGPRIADCVVQLNQLLYPQQ